MSLADSLRGEQHPQGSGQSGTEFHGGDVPEIPHKRCVCGGRQCVSKLNDQGASYYLKRDEIPQSVIDAVVCMEDQRFYQHRGVDFRALVRAAKH